MPLKPITSNETDYTDYITFKLKNNQQFYQTSRKSTPGINLRNHIDSKKLLNGIRMP